MKSWDDVVEFLQEKNFIRQNMLFKEERGREEV